MLQFWQPLRSPKTDKSSFCRLDLAFHLFFHDIYFCRQRSGVSFQSDIIFRIIIGDNITP